MSYDLMVFEPSVAPREKAAFDAWYDQQTSWSEGHHYNDPSVTSAGLASWYADMIREFPSIATVPDNEPDEGSLKYTEYNIGKFFIYATFRWPEAENAYAAVTRAAMKHRVGFFDVSGHGQIWFPDN